MHASVAIICPCCKTSSDATSPNGKIRRHPSKRAISILQADIECYQYDNSTDFGDGLVMRRCRVSYV